MADMSHTQVSRVDVDICPKEKRVGHPTLLHHRL
jgi:hypothetical protein